jgi:thiol-disulfide isomerase/thioredoxin
VAGEPADAMVAAVQKYGASLGKTPTAIDDELWALREKQAKPATPFSLQTFDGRPVALSDYKGRVFLFNLWFPACGPCRKEFPYVQKVLDKFKSRGFEVVAVNIRQEEDEFVVPFMKGNGYGFLPLKAPKAWIEQNFKGMIAPQNFLIDADGRVMFRPTVQSPDGQRTLENEIEALLNRLPAK